MGTRKMNLAVIGDMNGALHSAAYWAVTGAVHRAVREPVYWALDKAVYRAVGGAVYRAVHDAVEEDSDHPGLQDFLLVVGKT